MAVQRTDEVYTYTAGEDLSTHQYKVVKFSGDKEVELNDNASTTKLAGILQNKPQEGEAADVATGEHPKAVLGGTVTAGAYLNADANGKLVAVTADQGRYCAIAQEGGDANELIEVQWVGQQTISVA